MQIENLDYPFKTKDILGIRDNFALNKGVKSFLCFENSTVENPDISIVIPTYAAKYIRESIESALWQKNAPSYEIVIVENNPEEDSEPMIEFLKKQERNVFRYFRNEKNIGMAGNWNRCVELAKSDNIVFLHSDDWMMYDCLHNLWEIHQKVEANAAILGHEHFMDQKRNILNWYAAGKRLLFLKKKPHYKATRFSRFMGEFDNGCCELINKQVAIQVGGFDDLVYPGIDCQFFAKYLAVAPLYRGDFAVRCCRLADVSASLKEVTKYRANGYYLSNAIVDKWFGGNKFLKYIIALKAKNAFFPKWGDTNKRYKLAIHEKLLLRLTDKFYHLKMNYL